MKNTIKKTFGRKIAPFLCEIWAFLIMLSSAGACGSIKHLPPAENNHTVEVRDSVRIVDSIRVIPIEKVTDIVALPDTLYLETSLATATAFYDTTFNALKGSIENKAGATFEKHIEYKDREVHDTLRIKEPFPVPVEVKTTPKAYPWSLALNFVFIVLIGGWIYLKVKKFPLVK